MPVIPSPKEDLCKHFMYSFYLYIKCFYLNILALLLKH